MIYYKVLEYSYSCSVEFMIKNTCGTFFEVHKPEDETILYSQRINKTITPEEFNFEFFNLNDFETGEYQV